MDSGNYDDEVEYSTVTTSTTVKFHWRPFLNQILVCSGIWTVVFIDGLIVGAPAVLIPQIRKESNSTTALSDEMASWISSARGISGVPWVFIIPILAEYFGRRIPHFIVLIVGTVGYFIFYFSNSIVLILIGECILGIYLPAIMLIYAMVLAEFVTPRYRGIFLTFKSVAFFWGIWVANAVGTYFHWKNIGAIALICKIYCIITAFAWPESPYWLSSKGRFLECSKSYRWLRGTDLASKAELKKLIHSQKAILLQNSKIRNNICWKQSIQLVKNILYPEFYKPLLISLTLLSLYVFSGKLVCTMYILDLLKKISKDESKSYKTMLILDGTTVLCMYVSSMLTRFLKRRLQILCFATIGVIFLIVMAIYLFLIQSSIIQENYIVSLLILTGFSIAISCGPMTMTTSVYAELIPMRFKTSCMFIVCLYTNVLYTCVLKTAPSLFKLSLPGAFLFYGLSSIIFITILFKYLPETKDKTLLEIEQYYFKQKPVDTASAELKRSIDDNPSSRPLV